MWEVSGYNRVAPQWAIHYSLAYTSWSQFHILEVICKYVQIDPEMVTVQLEQKDGDISILELNVTLPEAEES
ncbi:cell division topological specificity factor MinE, partial [Salmonella enterica subsp. enterica serovar Montevideo]|nr:cell division topological specificity factor MinE [Salmonella enterica subsp. enterica serovar Montevideo]